MSGIGLITKRDKHSSHVQSNKVWDTQYHGGCGIINHITISLIKLQIIRGYISIHCNYRQIYGPSRLTNDTNLVTSSMQCSISNSHSRNQNSLIYDTQLVQFKPECINCQLTSKIQGDCPRKARAQLMDQGPNN